MNDQADWPPRTRQQKLPPPLHLGPVPEAAPQARQFVRDGLRQLGVETGVTEAAELGVSELVTNACLHARTAITVALRLVDDVIRVEVSDDSPGRPSQRDAGMTTTGRGLRLLSAYGTWGVNEATDGRIGKTVWFQPGVP